ncbi:(d)CMP kinase [soil metagenome]
MNPHPPHPESTAPPTSAGGAFHLDKDRRLIITIDGPAGTGKSTTARELARRLELEFLDTGAMYRAAAALALDAGLTEKDEVAVAEILEQADLHFNWKIDPPRITARAPGGAEWIDLTDRIRTPAVEKLVSPLAAIAEVRRQLVRKQRLIGQQHRRLVSEGRDQGSVVFDDAEVKFYLFASAEKRAQRRYDQLRAENQPADYAKILRDIQARDESDRGRAVGPLIRPVDAIPVDSSDKPMEVVLVEMIAAVLARVGPQVRTFDPTRARTQA